MATASERRISDRFRTDFAALGSVVINDDVEFMLRDLSYGGFSMRFSGDAQEISKVIEALHETSRIQLRILGVQVEGTARKAFSTKDMIGCSFCHGNTKVLVFLRNFLEYMRWGARLDLLDKKLLKERYRTDEWVCYRGEGPTDAFFRLNGDGTLAEALITFRDKEEYREVAWKEGAYVTRLAIDHDGDASRMSSTSGIDKGILRKGLSILVGLSQQSQHKSIAAQLVKAGSELLKK